MSSVRSRSVLRFFTIAAPVLFAMATSSFHADAQRLPQTVVPEHYTLSLMPNLEKASFAGNETIDVTVTQPTQSITLNAAEINFTHVTVILPGATSPGGIGVPATVSLDADKEQAKFTFPMTIPAGKAKLVIQYGGMLNNELRGFYLSKTPKRNYAVTQFESTDARRAFPSFDEPAFKATFDIALTVATDDTVISNTNMISDTPVSPKQHVVTFATTPKMSTYLVAFLVGDFKCVSGESDGTPIRACATPGQEEKGRYALSAAEYILHYYNTYFGIKYPMPKLDMIAIPDFEAGAMENFGAITYRETALLIDEKTASLNQRKSVASVVAHEMAHQWFGDMVTMQWWDNLWLNEGFASWMSSKPLEQWHPEWHMTQDKAAGLDGTLNLDSSRTTHAIRAKADTPSEINEMFDGISYGKGSAVLAMVENYLGQETFRQGVHNYLAAHLYSNATAEDFWNAQTVTSGKPVDKVMTSFVAQPGVPLLTFSEASATTVSVRESRFFLNGDPVNQEASGESWTIPVCFKVGAASPCELLSNSAAPQTLKPPSSSFLFADGGAMGYYRTAYPKAAYDSIVANAETALMPEERISLIGNEWAMMRSDKASVGDYLDLVNALKADPNASVLRSAVGDFDAIDSRIATTDQERAELSAWIRNEFSAEYKAMGPFSPNEDADKKALRNLLFSVLGSARDPAILAEAHVLAEKYVADPASVDPNLAPIALAIAATNGGTSLYNEIVALHEKATDPGIQTQSLLLMADFKDPALVQRTLDTVAAGKIRNQDSWRLLSMLLSRRDTSEQTWTYMQHNWDKVQAQFTTSSGNRVVGAAGNFCSVEKRDEVTSFFTTHKVIAAERTLKQAADSIDGCIQLRQQQEPNLKAWLAKQGGTSSNTGQ